MTSTRTTAMTIPAGETTLEGELMFVDRAEAIVLFVDAIDRHGLDRPHTRLVAAELARHGISPLLIDLVTRAERAAGLFDGGGASLAPLAERLWRATEWAIGQPEVGGRPLGYFGLGSGAAVALMAAAARPDLVAAVVCGDVRPEAAGAALGLVEAPTLVVAEGGAPDVLAADREALERIKAAHAELIVLPDATTLQEPPALEAVTRLAVGWFERFLVEAMKDATGIEAV